MANSNHSSIQENLISVIIPTLNEATNIFETLLAARRSYTKSEAEVILVDGGSTDGTLDLIPEGVMVVRSMANRAHQMNRGVEVSHGSVLLFCHGDTRLPLGWREFVLEALLNPKVSGGAFQSRLEPETCFLKLGNRVQTTQGLAVHVRRPVPVPAPFGF